MAKRKESFTAEEIAAATTLLHQVIRVLDDEYDGIEETCADCGADTSWAEAMYEVLGRRWLCPQCWDNAVGPVLRTSETEQPVGEGEEG